MGVLGHRCGGRGLAVGEGSIMLTQAEGDQTGETEARFMAFSLSRPRRILKVCRSFRRRRHRQGNEHHLREMFQPTEVENYPDGKGPMRGAKFQERFRGKHQLQRDENGLEKCVACFLCAAACPSNCIYIEAAENTEEKRISSAERYAKVYNIDYNRCIFCGYCVEACPTDAITHGHGFELASLNATNSGHAQGRPAGPDADAARTL